MASPKVYPINDRLDTRLRGYDGVGCGYDGVGCGYDGVGCGYDDFSTHNGYRLIGRHKLREYGKTGIIH